MPIAGLATVSEFVPERPMREVYFAAFTLHPVSLSASGQGIKCEMSDESQASMEIVSQVSEEKSKASQVTPFPTRD